MRKKIEVDEIYQFGDYGDYLRVNYKAYYNGKSLLTVFIMGAVLGGITGLILGYIVG